MNSKLKQIIFKKLYRDLSHVEIICHTDGSIWFIDREEKYWYLEFKKSGELWWRWQFFSNFFQFFSMKQSEYEPIIVEWVEEVLNRKVVSSPLRVSSAEAAVEDVLNRKVVSSLPERAPWFPKVEDVLNRKADSTQVNFLRSEREVEDVLNIRIVSSLKKGNAPSEIVEEVLNRKAATSTGVYGS